MNKAVRGIVKARLSTNGRPPLPRPHWALRGNPGRTLPLLLTFLAFFVSFVSFGQSQTTDSAEQADATKLRATSRPNILLIISDDLRDTVGCYGNATVKTPNLDRLAARGVRFHRAYAQYPVCNPSRTSFMTGLRCEQTGVVGNTTMFRSKLPEIVTMPQLLRQHSWYAASYGKIYHVGEAAGEIRNGWMDVGKSWDEAQMFQPTPAGRKGEVRNLTGGRLKWCSVGAMEGTDDDPPDGQNALHAIRAIEEQTAARKSWFIGAGFHRPHDPFLVPKKYFDLYPPGALKLYRDPADMTAVPRLSMPGGAFKTAFDAFTDQDRLDFLRAYYAGVSFTDAQVGRLLDTLDRLKLWDNTVVIFAGDNGYHHNERNWWNKNTLFERSCRVPLIIAAPNAKSGQVCQGLVELVDFYPTVADYCGLKAPHQLAGQSLRPLLENPSGKGRDAAFTLVTRGQRQHGQSVRTDRWRYTRWSDGTAELYDESADPQENQNLAGHAKHQAQVAELARLLDTLPPFKNESP
jgi:iduronate 2-sulfatase